MVRSLKESGQNVVMITGDAPLTGFHVAKQVSIAEKEKPGLLLREVEVEEEGQKKGNGVKGVEGGLSWVEITADEDIRKAIPFHAKTIPSLAKDYTLVVTGKLLN